MNSKIALITGATSGFGRAIADKLASQGYSLIITGRRSDRLAEIASDFRKNYQIEVLEKTFDVRKRNEVEDALLTLPSEWKAIDVLINNAGLALGRESIDEANVNDWDQMIDTNVKGLLYVTRCISPLMINRNQGTIINIGSIAGRETYPGGNVYSATKFAVDSLTRGMRMDLVSHGIRVGQIAPGAAETEFSIVRFKNDEAKAQAVYKGYHALSAIDIAEAAWFMVSRPSHVCISDLLIMPTAQASATLFHKVAQL